MDIEILKILKENPTKNSFKNESISIDEIVQLEQIYNHGHAFPKALRELLFLAGKYCNVMDYGLNDTQQQMQEEARDWLKDFNRCITRPFFVTDVYNAGEQFLFIYLDEGITDPVIYEAYLPHEKYETRPWVHSLERTLSKFIEYRMEMVINGYNPF